MKAVYISGWATTPEVWRSVPDTGIEPVFLCWNNILQGDFTLPESCIVTGWSLGGQLAMDISRRTEVRGMVVVSSSTCITAGGHRPGIEPERSSMISAMLSRSRRGYLRSFFMECGASGEVLEELLTDSDSFTMPELISGLAVMFNHTAMPEPHIPSVVIHGTEDRIIPFEVSGYLSSKILRNSRLVAVEGGGHLLPIHASEVIARAVKDLAGSLHA